MRSFASCAASILCSANATMSSRSLPSDPNTLLFAALLMGTTGVAAFFQYTLHASSPLSLNPSPVNHEPDTVDSTSLFSPAPPPPPPPAMYTLPDSSSD